MKPNDIVTIYQKPLTFEDREGDAILIRQYRSDDGDGISQWIVKFLDEPQGEYVRTIYNKRKL